MANAVIWVLAAGAALAAVWFWAGYRRWPMDSQARAEAPGQFAQLSGGLTHYRWDGHRSGPVVVCVHGLSSASYVWEPVVKLLTTMGYRVLRYDLYGRGLSDRPKGRQDKAFFLRQLRELLKDQGLEGDLMLMGYSMGGAIATAFAAEETHRVDRLVLLAPAGLGCDLGRFFDLCARVPGVGDWAMQVLGGAVLRRQVRQGARQPLADATIPDLQQAETRFRGYLRAVLSSQRHFLHEPRAEDHAQIARAGVPVLAIWGQEDTVIPLTAMGRLAKINRTAMQAEITGAGHALPYTHPREIREALQAFLRDF